VVAKNSFNGSLNPIAQIRKAITVEEVLASREIVAPLTRHMCAGIGDGAAVLVLCSERFALKHGKRGPSVRASQLASGGPLRNRDLVQTTVREAYEKAGLGPKDISVVELHDAAAPAEIMTVEELGLVADGDGPSLLRDGSSSINGRLPVNPSGGLIARGHPIGATGAAQIVELVDQLRGRAGARQVREARIGLAENAGGSIMGGGAACVITILEAAL
jgi:acetyl-CoA acetyltransferase